jgi:glycosyltransferase involved in cell wall biosynthesis
MKICLAGNYSRSERPGSSLLKVQQQLFKYLTKQFSQTLFFESSEKKNIYHKLFDKLEFIQLQEGILVRGGVINIILYLKKNNYGIIHFIDDRYYMILICFLNFILKAKIITTFHETLNFRSRVKKLLPHLRRVILIKFSDLILVFSKDDQRLLKKSYPNKQIKIVRNGVDIVYFSPKINQNSKNLILFCGGLSYSYKGLNFLESSLNKVYIEYNFVICGKNESQDKHQSYIGELSPVKIREMYRLARIVVVPSQYDAFSLTVLEAMACGIPTILTKQCGVANYLKDGAGCFIVDFGDTEKLAQRISILLKDDTLWQKMNIDAAKVSKNFEWGIISFDYIKQYQELLLS